MKIGIYGDSYADSNNVSNPTNWFNSLSNKIQNDSQLAKTISDDISHIKVDNYAKAGSSLYFSYKNFLKTNSNYDLVIFFATEPNRYPVKFQPSNIPGSYFYITSVPHVEQLEESLSQSLTSEEKLFLQNLKGWFNASNEEYNQDVSSIILDNIEKMHPNVLIYPCFTNSFTSERFKKYKLDQYLHPLHSFWHRQLELFEIDYNGFVALEKDTLSGHLTPEFNEYISQILFSKLKTGKWDHKGFFDIKIKLPKTHYYKNWD